MRRVADWSLHRQRSSAKQRSARRPRRSGQLQARTAAVLSEAAGLRVELDARNEKMNAKIREFTLQKVPFVLIVGDKEAAAEAVSVRTRGKGDEGSVALVDFIERAKGLLASKNVAL